MRLESLEDRTASFEVLCRGIKVRRDGRSETRRDEVREATWSNSWNLGPEMELPRLARKPLLSAGASILRCLICVRTA